jgi:murein DD-endopeptidase MepM/ murein hydrolase activator NlpD
VRRALAVSAAVLALAVGVLVVSAPPASAGDPVKDRKAAQQRANAAAARVAKASSDLARVERQLAQLEAKAEATQAKVDGLQQQVRAVAVNAYIRGSDPGAGALVMGDDINQTARGQALARFATLGDTDAIDAYRAAREDLDANHDVMASQLKGRRDAVAKLRKQKAAAYAELQKLAAVERAYLAKLEAQRKAAAARRGRVSSRSAGAGSTSARAVGVIASGSWVCPVQGPRAFSNDWGQPRSGGRRHQGNDILAPRGTPVVANVGGSVQQHRSSLGGLSYYLHGDDGNTYYGAHLSGYAAGGRVSAGTVIGYVGDTGNARGTPHLHFEIHVGGGAAVNPYATLRTYC